MIDLIYPFIFVICVFFSAPFSSAQSLSEIEIEDPEELMIYLDELPSIDSSAKTTTTTTTTTTTSGSELNDLEQFEKDFGRQSEVVQASSFEEEMRSGKGPIQQGAAHFDVGLEERQLLEISSYVENQFSDKEWKDVVGYTKVQTYTVRKGDWLFKIARKLFGSGFYYPKIWALNPYITNPHEIEPGMVLVFDTGNVQRAPRFSIDQNGFAASGAENQESKDDSSQASETKGGIESWQVNNEFKKYSPPPIQFLLPPPSDQFDRTGFDRNSKVNFSFKSGKFLNSFIVNNKIQDLGKIDSAIRTGILLRLDETLYLDMDHEINIVPGDRFSVYKMRGNLTNERSERKGDHYDIVGTVEVIKKNGHLWEAKLTELTGEIERGDRITTYTPRIERTKPVYGSRIIEGIIFHNYYSGKNMASLGDIVYIDRGRADGVEIGQVFQVYDSIDRRTKENIRKQPTYVNGELMVISLSDNFATTIVTQQTRDFKLGDIVRTKDKLEAAKSFKLAGNQGSYELGKKTGNQLDVEMELEDLNADLLAQAERVKLTEDELAELERLEREKSILQSAQKNVSDLERLEKELEEAEKLLSESSLDRDKLLEGSSLETIEKEQNFAADTELDDVEERFGKKYLDEELNSKDNPYGLTEFDIEEVDELLNLSQRPEDNSEKDESL